MKSATNKNMFTHILLALIASALLSACGGGDAGAPTTPVSPATPETPTVNTRPIDNIRPNNFDPDLSYMYGIAFSGNKMYVGSNDLVTTFDISNPSALTLVQKTDLADYPNTNKVVVEGGRLYVSPFFGEVIDVFFISGNSLTLVSSLSNLDIDKMVVKNSRVYGAGSNGLYVINFTDDSVPYLALTLPLVGAGPEAIDLEGNTIVTASNFTSFSGDAGSLNIYDIGGLNVDSPVTLSRLELPEGEIRGVLVDGDYVYFAATETGVLIVDISDLSAPVLVDIVNTPGSASALAIYEDFLLVADGTAGMQAIDISDPTDASIEETFVVENTIGIESWVSVVEVSGNHAYVIDGIDGVFVFNLTGL